MVKLEFCNGDLLIVAVLYLQPQCHPYRVCINCAVFYKNICCFIAARNNSKPINVNSQVVRRVYVFCTVEYVELDVRITTSLIIAHRPYVRTSFLDVSVTNVVFLKSSLNAGAPTFSVAYPCMDNACHNIVIMNIYKTSKHNNSNRQAKRRSVGNLALN